MRIKPGSNWKGYLIKESEIRYAMASTKSFKEAARFLHISTDTLKKYAKGYIDEESGKTLYQLLLEKGKSTPKIQTVVTIDSILEGKHPGYDRKRLHYLLIREMIFPEECGICGFRERRLHDNIIPLILTMKDGNKRNLKKDNLEFLCYNCYFLYVGNIGNAKPISGLEEFNDEPGIQEYK